MRISIEKQGQVFGYRVTHGDEPELFISARGFNRSARARGKEPWDDLVRLWDHPDHAKRTDELYNIYRQAESIQDETEEEAISTTGKLLIGKVNELYPMHIVEDMFRSSVSVPDAIENNVELYRHSTSERARTYDPEEYRQLALLSLQLRIYMPILAPCIDALNGSQHVNTEKTVWQYFHKTDIYDCAAIRRLEDYIEVVLKTAINPKEAFLSSISAASLPIFILATTLFRKLVNYDIEDKTLNIVSHIYKYVETQPKNLQRSQGGEVRQRSSVMDNDERSRLDVRHHVNTDTYISDEVMYSVEASDLNRLVKNIPKSFIPNEREGLKQIRELARAIKSNSERMAEDYVIQEFQYVLALYAYRAIPFIYLKSLRAELDNVFAVAQYIYLKVNRPLLASLMTAQYDRNKTVNIMATGHIKSDLKSRLSEQYTKFSIKQPTGASSQATARTLPNSINALVTEIVMPSKGSLLNLLPEGMGYDDVYISEGIAELRTHIAEALYSINNEWSK